MHAADAVRNRLPLITLATALAMPLVVAAPHADAAESGYTVASHFAPAAPPRLVNPEDRYAMANGCYAVEATGGFIERAGGGWATTAASADAAEPFYFKPTDLGTYMLFGTQEDFLAVDATPIIGGGIVAGAAPGPDADWEIDGPGGGPYSITFLEDGQALSTANDGSLSLTAANPLDIGQQFDFTLEADCAQFPEIGINVTGPHPIGEHPVAETRGYFESHMHLMANEFLGGDVNCAPPWHRYGVTVAMVDCPDHEGDGNGAILENFLLHGTPTGSHDPVGWPTFKDWPAPRSLTHQMSYYRGIERAWRSGLRMYVNLSVENRVLCELYPVKHNDCNEMNSVRLQNQRIRELERYIDAQSGGPGEGWFRIVTNPFEARKVINDGDLAVIMGIEVSEPFGCIEIQDIPQCTQQDIDEQLQEMYDAGIRQMELLNKFDNALSGVAGDGGTFGILVGGVGQNYTSGHFWAMETCTNEDAEHEHDKEQETLEGQADQDAIFGAIISQFAPPGTVPLYPDPPHCNTRGLTDLGEYTLREMAKKGMIIDPDHMSLKARGQALDLIEELGYHGVTSSHDWSTPSAYRRIYEAGGAIGLRAGSANGYINAWREHLEWADPRYYFGLGYGADGNGFGGQPGATHSDEEPNITYPFTGFGGVTIDQHVAGERVYDINVDGVAQYGIYPDLWEVMRLRTSGEMTQTLERGPEAYLQMWERAVGVPTQSCVTQSQIDALTPGMSLEDTLRTAGQPISRDGGAYTYCRANDPTGTDGVVVEFDANCNLSVVAAGVIEPAPEPSPNPLPTTGAGLGIVAVLTAIGAARRRRMAPERPS